MARRWPSPPATAPIAGAIQRGLFGQHRRQDERRADRRPFPLLLIRGLSSDIVSDHSVAALRDQLPWADVAGAGHMIAGDRNDAFNAAMLDFLAQHMPVGTSATTRA